MKRVIGRRAHKQFRPCPPDPVAYQAQERVCRFVRQADVVALVVARQAPQVGAAAVRLAGVLAEEPGPAGGEMGRGWEVRGSSGASWHKRHLLVRSRVPACAGLRAARRTLHALWRSLCGPCPPSAPQAATGSKGRLAWGRGYPCRPLDASRRRCRRRWHYCWRRSRWAWGRRQWGQRPTGGKGTGQRAGRGLQGICRVAQAARGRSSAASSRSRVVAGVQGPKTGSVGQLEPDAHLQKAQRVQRFFDHVHPALERCSSCEAGPKTEARVRSARMVW